MVGYTGGQREGIIGGALFEALARDRIEAIAKLDAGEIKVGACHDFGCVGSLAGIYTASMPVFVVEDRAFGNVAFCNIYEGSNPRRLNYGVYDEASGIDCSRCRTGGSRDRGDPPIGQRRSAQTHH